MVFKSKFSKFVISKKLKFLNLMSSTENATLNQEFISFLECYRLDNYSEALHRALYYLATEGHVSSDKQIIYHALHNIRHYLNEMEHSYLPPQTSTITQNEKSSPTEVKMTNKQI